MFSNKLLCAAILLSCSLAQAEYMVMIPLEQSQGGSLPDNTVNVGNGSNSGSTEGDTSTTPTAPTSEAPYDGQQDCYDNSNAYQSITDNYDTSLIGVMWRSKCSVQVGLYSDKAYSDAEKTELTNRIKAVSVNYATSVSFMSVERPDPNVLASFDAVIDTNTCPEARNTQDENNKVANCIVAGNGLSQSFDMYAEDNFNTQNFTVSLSGDYSSATSIQVNNQACGIDYRNYDNSGIWELICNNATMLNESDVNQVVSVKILK